MPILLVDFQHKAIEFEPMVVAVELLERKPSHLYRIQLGGYFWMFWLGKNVRSEVQNFSLKSDGKLRILVGDATPVIHQIKALFRTLPPQNG